MREKDRLFPPSEPEEGFLKSHHATKKIFGRGGDKELEALPTKDEPRRPGVCQNTGMVFASNLTELLAGEN